VATSSQRVKRISAKSADTVFVIESPIDERWWKGPYVGAKPVDTADFAKVDAMRLHS